jgi:ferric-dicitrate binding protein FerR (iron transport regulator)
MKKHSPLLMGLVVLMSLAMVIPPDLAAQAQAAPANQRAGEVSRVIPQVRIVRGTQQITGAANYPVDWGDLINTQRSGRARISLDDGSVINVGSDSSLKITAYSPGQQQTQMDLAYGSLRSKVAKITQPNGKFEVNTPVGVAGVVGTDFYILYQDGMMQLIVFEGRVRFCDRRGVCVILFGGMMSTIRGNNQPPDAPMPAPPSMLAEAGAGTEAVGAGVAVAAAPSTLTTIGLIAAIGVSAVVIPIVVSHDGGRGAPPAPTLPTSVIIK